MVKVTDNARLKLLNMLLGHGRQLSLRLVMDPSQRLGLVLDKESASDEIIEYEGSKVLLVNRALAPLLNGATLDTKSEEGNLVLTLDKS